eukprot:gene13581-30540_t
MLTGAIVGRVKAKANKANKASSDNATAPATYAATADGKFLCPHCNVTFANVYGVIRHVKRSCNVLYPAKAKAKAKAKVEKANKASSDNATAAATYAVTADGKSLCPHCNVTFVSVYGVMRHVENSCLVKFPEKKKKPASAKKKKPASAAAGLST